MLRKPWVIRFPLAFGWQSSSLLQPRVWLWPLYDASLAVEIHGRKGIRLIPVFVLSPLFAPASLSTSLPPKSSPSLVLASMPASLTVNAVDDDGHLRVLSVRRG